MLREVRPPVPKEVTQAAPLPMKLGQKSDRNHPSLWVKASAPFGFVRAFLRLPSGLTIVSVEEKFAMPSTLKRLI